jgi:hypothetical protein
LSWKRVIHAYELDQYGVCPVCKIEYSECDCPGPTQDDEYEYKVEDNKLFARKRKNALYQ